MTNQQQLLHAIRQEKLKPRLMELLDAGLTRETIEACLKEHAPTPQRDNTTHRKALRALIAARTD